MWSDFIISMMVRNANQIQRAESHSKPIINQFKEEIKWHEQEIYQREIKRFEANIANITVAAMSGHEDHQNQLEFTQRFRDVFTNLNWWIEDFNSLSLNLITSDQPVLIYPVSLKACGNELTKLTDLLTNHDFLISIPLSPTVCFFAYKGTPPKKRKPEILRAQNFNMISHAHKFIYTNNLDHQKFISRYFKEKQVRRCD